MFTGRLGVWSINLKRKVVWLLKIWRLPTWHSLLQQGWRLQARLIRGLYFPNGSFMTAKKGRKASWFWNTVLHGRDVLLARVRWQVGDGRCINFWCNKWFSSTPDFSFLRPKVISQIIYVLHILLEIKAGTWKYLVLSFQHLLFMISCWSLLVELELMINLSGIIALMDYTLSNLDTMWLANYYSIR